MAQGTFVRPLPRRGAPADPRVFEQRVSPVSFELGALAGLVLATAAFGRSFSQIELGFSWLYPTEVVLAVILVVSVVRAGPAQSWARLASTGVVVPLALVWLLGTVATARGLSEWGFSMTIEDIGLVEYSLIIPIVALTVTNRERLLWLCSVIGVGGILAIAVQSLALWTPLQWDVAGKLDLIAVATGMYISLYVAWVLARAAGPTSLPRWHYPVAVLGVALVVIGVARAAWVALIAGAIVIVVLAAPGRRLLLTAGVLGALGLGIALSVPVENLSFGAPPDQTEQPAVANELTASFDEGGAGGQSANSSWRLAFWSYSVEEAAKQPLNGVGFGTPANFTWSGITYDARTGDAADPFDVSPPHNSFVNILYRMGVPALLALVAILVLAVWRLLPLAWRSTGEDRAISTWLLAALAITFVVANFAVALEGPYMGIFFWTILGLTTVAPRVLTETRA